MSSFLSNLELMWDFGTFPFPIMYTDVTGKQYKRERMIQLYFAIIPESTVIQALVQKGTSKADELLSRHAYCHGKQEIFNIEG